MKTLFLLIHFLLICFLVHAQTLDNTILVCQYKANTIKITAQAPMNDLIRLEIGKNISKSYSVYSARSDSFELSPNYQARFTQMSEQVRQSVMGGMELDDAIESSGILPVRDRVVVYKNYPKGKMTVLDRINSKQYEYIDKLNSQNWEIQADTMTILGYTCQKAVTEWRGRRYEAWFAAEIPINEGPMKFGGLPGLIFKLNDVDKEYNYEIEGIEKKVLPIKMDIPIKQKEFIKTDRKKFVRAYRNFLKHFGLVMAAESGINVATDASLEKKGYDLMELDIH